MTWIPPNNSRVDFYHYQLKPRIVDNLNNTLMVTVVSNTTEDTMVVFPGLQIPHNNISFILSAHNCNGASAQVITNIGKT